MKKAGVQRAPWVSLSRLCMHLDTVLGTGLFKALVAGPYTSLQQ
jgi:hypothetical protein